MELYKSAVKKSILALDSNPVIFKRAFTQKVSFLMPGRGGFRLSEDDYFLPLMTNPIQRIDICEALLANGETPPFNCIEIDRNEILGAREILLNLGPAKIRKTWKAIGEKYRPMPELKRYVKKHRH